MSRITPLFLATTSLALLVVGCRESEADTHHRAAIKAYDLGDFATAAAEYDKVYELNKSLDERVQKKGAQAWAKAKEFARSAAIFERLANTKQGKERADLYREIAAMYMGAAGDFDAAEAWYKKALELEPKDDRIVSWLAELSAIRGGARSQTAEVKPEHLELALTRYDEAIALNPTQLSNYINKRIIFVRFVDYYQKQHTQALADVEANKRDKKVREQFQEDAARYEKAALAYRQKLEENNAKIGELAKAAHAAEAAKKAEDIKKAAEGKKP